jgi:tetratricopeptide (TPR) repeat protein
LNKIGDQRLRAGPGGARQAADVFGQSLCLRRRLYESGSSDTEIQSDVSWSLERLGQARQALGDLDGAEVAFLEAVGLRRTLLNHDARNAVWLRDLYVILTRFGLLQLERHAYDLAFAYLGEAERHHGDLKVRKELQNWMPSYVAGFHRARIEIGGHEAVEILRSLDAFITRFEAPRLGSLLIRRPSAAECWPATIAGLQALARSRIMVGSIDY